MKYISDSIKGRNRAINKDRTLIIESEDFHLFALFDGISSAKSSKKGIQKSIHFIRKNYRLYLKDLLPEIDRLLFDLNSDLVSSNLEDPYSTCSLLLIPQNSCKSIQYVNIGDSRIYSISNQYLKLFSEAEQSELNKNQLSNYLGKPDLDSRILKISTIQRKSENFIICSDGFYKIMENHKRQFFKIFQYGYLKNLQKALKKEISKKNTDDATYIFINTSYV